MLNAVSNTTNTYTLCAILCAVSISILALVYKCLNSDATISELKQKFVRPIRGKGFLMEVSDSRVIYLRERKRDKYYIYLVSGEVPPNDILQVQWRKDLMGRLFMEIYAMDLAAAKERARELFRNI